jgi:tetratricopeptide (TPR) repeat protein
MQVGHVYQNRAPKEVFASFYLTLGTQLAARGQILAAEQLLGDASRWMPDNPTAHLNYGIVLESLDKLDQAATQYELALQVDPKLTQASYNLGLLKDKQGETQQGLPYLLEALRHDPSNPLINYDAGVLYAKLNDYQNSAKYSKLALEANRDFAEAYNNYGYALTHLGRYQEALAAIEQSLKLKPDSAAALDSKGFALFGMGHYQEALAEYQKALQLDATIGEIHLHLAQTYEKLGEKAKAVQAYETYLKLTPQATDKATVETRISELKQ